ncbi:MAG: hypothetical protein WC876_10245 [Candidatus Thermoplasmatota archaeon]|jgi:hypothetical protein
MLGRFLLAAALVATLFSGCLGDNASPGGDDPTPAAGYAKAGYAYTGPGNFFAGPALYEDPQNTPHPAYNWPTLSHPAVGPDVPALWKPMQGTDLPMEITELKHVVQTPGVESGAGIALFGSLAVVPSYSTSINSSIVDISDPTQPKVIGSFLTQLAEHRGATILAYPTGRLVTVISTGSGLDVWDITDPTSPQPLPPVSENPDGSAFSSHKVGVVPGTPIIYNAGSSGGAENGIAGPEASTGEGVGVTEMFDFSDPENVVRLPDFANGYSCHHIYFWNNVTEGKFRSTCAGIEYTQIIDTTDPKAPEVIVSVPYGLGDPTFPSQSVFLLAFSHYAGLSRDGTILLVGDENGGGLGPIGCVARVDTPAGAVSVPVGAVWFYDVSDESNPVYLSHVSASQMERAQSYDPTGAQVDPSDPAGTAAGAAFGQASCTAHHGRLVPAVDKDVLAMSFYGAGVLVIDFTAVRNEGVGLPTVVAQYAGTGANVWETWYYSGYLFTGDMGRGMDILDIE